MTYGYRSGRSNRDYNDWHSQPTDWRQWSDDPRAAAAESAISWLIDRGIMETVGLAPDGDLLLRLTEKAWDQEQTRGEERTEMQAPANGRESNRPRGRTRRRQPPANSDPQE